MIPHMQHFSSEPSEFLSVLLSDLIWPEYIAYQRDTGIVLRGLFTGPW